MNEKCTWYERHQANFFVVNSTGKIIGRVNNLAGISSIWIALAYTGNDSFTVDDEKHLGQYIDCDSAKNAVEYFWDRLSRTLIQ